MNIRTTLKKTLAGFAAAALLIPSPALLASCAKQKPGGTAPAGNLPAQTEPEKEPETAAQSEREPETASPAEPTPAPDGLILPPSDGSAPDFPNDGKIYVEYAVNYAKAGTVKNGGRREASAGGKKAEAVPNFGYRFVGWSDGLTDPVRPDSDAEIAESTRLTAIFDYDALDMPIITIDTETGRDVQSKTEYIQADLKICAAAPEYELSGTVQIRGRGNNSWGYEKKSYKMKFPEKVNLFGLGTGKDKVWVLLANVCDQSLQRNHVALELARNLDGIAFSPASLSVEVYLNGEYRGVYLLAEEIRDSKARVNIDTDGFETETDIGYLVELSSYSTGPGFTVGGKQYMIHSDLSEDQKIRREQILFITDYMERCMTAIRSGSREEVEKLMDIPSMIDTYITEEVVKNLDVGWDSYYLYKEKGGKLFLGPIWDFDLSLGNANEGEETIDGLFAATRSGSGGGNPWHYRPMEQSWFRELVLDRWNEVKPKLIDTIPAAVREEGSSKLRSYERNFIRWPIFGTRQNRETEAIRRLKTYTEHYEYLADWTEQRIAWLDSTYRKSDFLTMKLSSGGDVEDG
ncbi:MAG: CotH kinase family protein, partial [Clostridia bacterium]|nr:CotH kinase family protein [Clostridia bacterium]